MATVTLTRTRQYRDFNLAFTRHPSTRDVAPLMDDIAVKRAVRLLLNITAGEIPFMPSLGTRLRHLLFEPIDPINTALIENEIRDTLDAYEPRIQIQTLNVVPQPDINGYTVELVFTLINLPEPLSLTLSLKRLR